MLRYLIAVFLSLWHVAGYAWDNTGHRLIAMIAYTHLQPIAKEKIDALTALLDPGYTPTARFLYVAIAPDKWRANDKQLAGWHFIDSPWSTDHTATVAAATPNLITILHTSVASLANPTTKHTDQATALAYVVHLVGDAHQPLHCINRFSQAFLHGDFGANLVTIHSEHAHNLHAYWDQSARLLLPSYLHYPPSNKQVKWLAHVIEGHYPDSTLREKILDLTASNWAKDSFNIAQQIAYAIPRLSAPTLAYKRTQQAVAERQMALAGYRLAALLNQLMATY